MNRNKLQVKKFYQQVWDCHDKTAIPQVLHPDVTFRGSLGQQKKGHQGFAEYLDMVHLALADYKCMIKDLVAEDNKVFAKMIFFGIHQGDFMGYSPSGKKLSWNGCALFTFEDDLIVDIWVLGDLKSLELQLLEDT